MDHNADTGIFKRNFYQRGTWTILQTAANSRSRRQILMNFVEGQNVPLAKTYNFGHDLDHNLDPGILYIK